MDIKGLVLFKNRFKLSDDFMEIIYSLFERLHHFGYISKSQTTKLIKKLNENINELYMGTKNIYDYKTGFYDASKKILYIKDESDIPSIYLRIIYAITTSEIKDKHFHMGYSITKMRTDSYKLEYLNFGINRAVVANLVCKLCDTLPVHINIVPTYKTYTHNFLGEEISSNNDIYALESKILSELCFATNLEEDVFYEGVFSRDPIKCLDDIFKKKRFKGKKDFLKHLDEISLNYSSYNKLIYLAKKLNENYLEIKKNALNDNIKELRKEKREIELQLLSITNKEYSPDVVFFDEALTEHSTNLGLSEKINELENMLRSEITAIQDILAKNIISSLEILKPYKYASRLVQFNNLLIRPNEQVSKKITETILYELIPTSEVKAVNIIQKIRYAIILGLLSTDQFENISNNFSFFNIEDLTDEQSGTTCVVLNANKMFAKIVRVSGLNKRVESGNLSAEYMHLDNLQYLISSDFSNIYVNDIEKLYTKITTDYDIFKTVSLENMYIFKYNKKDYLIIYKNSSTYVVGLNYENKEYSIILLTISDFFKVFDSNTSIVSSSKSNLPVVVRQKSVF